MQKGTKGGPFCVRGVPRLTIPGRVRRCGPRCVATRRTLHPRIGPGLIIGLTVATTLWPIHPALAVPHLIHGLRGVPGSVWTLARGDTLAGRDWLSAQGGLAFDAPSGSYRVAWVADPGGGPADVPDPPTPAPKGPRGGGCGQMGVEMLALGLLMRRRHAIA